MKTLLAALALCFIQIDLYAQSTIGAIPDGDRYEVLFSELVRKLDPGNCGFGGPSLPNSARHQEGSELTIDTERIP
jgi:hypothetical protein